MKNKFQAAIVIAIVFILVFCIVAVFFNVISVTTLPGNFIGATLGALIGALITLVLLRGQTAIEEEKGKHIKILEMKIEVFHDYIKDIWNVWNEQIITIDKFKNLTSKYYQNIMIYLSDDKIETIGNALTEMGSVINKNKYGDSLILRKNIILIIDTLSNEINLGGKIKDNIMEQHDKIVFPILLKNSILDYLNNKMPMETLEKGKYEIFREGSWDLEYICFNFKKYPDCKIVIGTFNGKKIEFLLVVDVKYKQIDKEIRGSGVWCQRVKFDHDINLRDPITNPIKDSEYKEDDKEIAPPLDFSNNDYMEKYRTDKRDFADTLAKRAAYWFSEARINRLDIGIIDFLEKYIK
jgi:hypothetical protein